MQLAHEASNVTCAIVTEKLLIQKSILFVIVELQAATFLAAEHGAQRFVDKALRANRQVLFTVVIKRHTVVRVLEKLDVLLQVLQIKLLLRLVEESLICLNSLKARRLLLERQDLLLAGLHAREELGQLAVVGVETALVVNLRVFKTLAVVSEPLGMLDDELVAVVDFADESVTLALVGLLQLGELPHHVISMLLKILEYRCLNVITLVDFIHAPLHRLVFILNLIFKDFALSLQVSQLHVDLLKDVEFAVRLENGLLQVLDLVVDLLGLLRDLVDAVLVRDEPVDDRINQLLDKITRLRLDIEPE